jgi:hypothetical protein
VSGIRRGQGPAEEPGRTGEPFLRVLRGRPTDAEVAALVAVLAARAGSTVEDPEPRSGWADPARRLASLPRPGPDAWRRSGLPG